MNYCTGLIFNHVPHTVYGVGDGGGGRGHGRKAAVWKGSIWEQRRAGAVAAQV